VVACLSALSLRPQLHSVSRTPIALETQNRHQQKHPARHLRSTQTNVLAAMLSFPSFIATQVGVLVISNILYKLYKFISLYFLQDSTLPRYLHPNTKDKCYALVTGSSDGIGLETAKLLHRRGFNVILHGRNQEKLKGIAKTMNEQYPSQRVVIVAADATDPAGSVPIIVKAVKAVEAEGGKLTVLMNNVGGLGMFNVSPYAALKDIPLDIVMKQIGLNATFPTALTSALLPNLIANQPGLVINIGSYAGVFGMPFLSIYAPSKAFNQTFSTSLSSEMKMLKADVEVIGVIVGNVDTPGNPGNKVGGMTLSPQEMANDILERVGCKKSLVVGSWKQCAGSAVMHYMPDVLREAILSKEIQKRIDKEAKKN
jgi:17beta-estradiol 17-dehydrogenase / very-long-chain 3-oxoacyl-CoA reductase